MQTIDVIVGGQFGSEAKGHITAQVINKHLDRGHAEIINIRIGGPNAGHTVYDANGNKFAYRTLPVAAALGHEDLVLCYIAPGSELDPPVLFKELRETRDAGHNPRIAISSEVTILTDEHKKMEADGDLTGKVGSTGKGIGASRAERLMRRADRLADRPDLIAAIRAEGIEIVEPRDIYDNDEAAQRMWRHQHLVIEGTQGYGLSLRYSGLYPQVTSNDCTALDFLTMAQIKPWRVDRQNRTTPLKVWVVARAYPIRVAGNSGPLEGETTWEDLGLPEEYTTVTQKVRRVGNWDAKLVADAIEANGGRSVVKLAITMADQAIPEIAGKTNRDFIRDIKNGESTQVWEELDEWLDQTVRSVDGEGLLAVVGTSPTSVIWLEEPNLDYPWETL